MRKVGLVLMICLFLLSCNDMIIDESGIESLEVFNNNKEKISVLNNNFEISNFVKKLNGAERKVIKFYPTYTIKISYQNGNEKILFSNGNNFKIDGLTYQMKQNVVDQE
ncbi:hypothetical protein ED312_08595 [Sinomicrobium pectinilyticum]|uniref:Uncharacterized protein n=1 Tax=Sinomicrobium pectinilyticum TaxID=1084421 RepID=A0A3N0EKS4_SINP1|nr:hypothetical protein [Sinomicrobium pectinilyticum]RNL88496.1 hypothetical protein ED312_08595 [Sinomicrobium pectinilyticum]